MPDGVPAEFDDPLFPEASDDDHGIKRPRQSVIIDLQQCFGLTRSEAEARYEKWGPNRCIREILAERGYSV